MANRFGGCFCLGSGPVLWCFFVFRRLLRCFRWRNASLAGGFAGRRVWLAVVVFPSALFQSICRLKGLYLSLYKCISCLFSCKDRAFSATSATLEEKKKRWWVREATKLHAETRDPPSQDPRDHGKKNPTERIKRQTTQRSTQQTKPNKKQTTPTNQTKTAKEGSQTRRTDNEAGRQEQTQGRGGKKAGGGQQTRKERTSGKAAEARGKPRRRAHAALAVS